MTRRAWVMDVAGLW